MREDAARHEEVAALSTTKKGGETLRGLVSRVLARDACIVFNHRYASYGTLLRRKESFVPMDPAQVEAAAAEAAAAEAAATTVL